jgi:hypothetical protein
VLATGRDKPAPAQTREMFETFDCGSPNNDTNSPTDRSRSATSSSTRRRVRSPSTRKYFASKSSRT